MRESSGLGFLPSAADGRGDGRSPRGPTSWPDGRRGEIRPEPPWLEDAVAAVRAELDRCARRLEDRGLLPAGRPPPAGKLLRPRLALILTMAGPRRPPPPTAAAIAASVEAIHLASLHHDDVLDGSSSRRRSAALRQGLGNKVSILYGDSLLVAGLDLLVRHGDRRMLRAVSRAVADTLRGEIRQHLRHRTPEVGDLECLRVARLKTGSLFGVAARLGASMGGGSDRAAASAARLGRTLGTAYQLVDDLLDYEGTPETLGKPPGTDHREGVATLPLAFAWRRASPAERQRLAAGFGCEDAGDFGTARRLVRSLGGAARCRDLAGALLGRARDRAEEEEALGASGSAFRLLDYVDEIEGRIPGPPRGTVERRRARL